MGEQDSAGEGAENNVKQTLCLGYKGLLFTWVSETSRHSRRRQLIYVPLYNIAQSQSACFFECLPYEKKLQRLKEISNATDQLLKSTFVVFWSQLLHDPSVVRFIDSYLLNALRPQDNTIDASKTNKEPVINTNGNSQHLAKQDGGAAILLERIAKDVLLTLHRLTKRVESKSDYISAAVYKTWLKQLHIIRPARLVDIAVLYGPSNPDIVSVIFSNLFETLPLLRKGFCEFGNYLTVEISKEVNTIKVLFNRNTVSQDVDPKLLYYCFSSFVEAAVSIICLITFSPSCIRLPELLLNTVEQQRPNDTRLSLPLLFRIIEDAFLLSHSTQTLKYQTVTAEPIRVSESIDEEEFDVCKLVEKSRLVLGRTLVLLIEFTFLPSVSEDGFNRFECWCLEFMESLTCLDIEHREMKSTAVCSFSNSLERGGIKSIFDKWQKLLAHKDMICIDDARLDYLKFGILTAAAPVYDEGPKYGPPDPSSECEISAQMLKDIQTVISVAGSSDVPLGEGFILTCIRHHNCSVEETLNALFNDQLDPSLARLDRKMTLQCALSNSIQSDQYSNDTQPAVKQGTRTRLSKPMKRQILSYAANCQILDDNQYNDEFDDTYASFDLPYGNGNYGGGDESVTDAIQEYRTSHKDSSCSPTKVETNKATNKAEKSDTPQIETNRSAHDRGAPQGKHNPIKGQTIEARRKGEHKGGGANHNRRSNFARKQAKGMIQF